VELNSLSNKYNHAYTPNDSPKHFGVYSPDTSFETLYFWIHISMVLELVLWIYYVNFPMLFFPVDIIRKFGFNWPVGLYVSDSTSGIIKKATSEMDYALFKEYAASKSIVIDLRNFYDSQPTLDDEEIWNTWHKERKKNDSFHGCYAKAVVEERATHEMLAVNTRKTETEVEKEFDEKDATIETFAKQYMEFSAWRKVYKSVK